MSASDPSVPIIVSVMSLISTIAVAILGYLFNSRQNNKIEEIKNNHNKEIEEIKHKLALQRDEQKAIETMNMMFVRNFIKSSNPFSFNL
jgi:hypothetical protein